jgi:sulfonate transport system permease protein
VKGRHLSGYLSSVFVVAALIGVWQHCADAQWLSPIFLPGPDKAWGSLVRGFSGGALGARLLATVERMAVGWFIASMVGIALGTLIGMSRNARAFLGPMIEAIRPIPASALVPVSIAFLGLSNSMVLAVVAFGAAWPMLLATINGLASVEPRLYEVGRILGLSRRDVALKIALPSAMPEILAGMRLSISIALVLTVLGEMLASRNGLGQWIVFAGRSFRSADLYAGVILLAILGVLAASLMGWVEKIVLHGRTP